MRVVFILPFLFRFCSSLLLLLQAPTLILLSRSPLLSRSFTPPHSPMRAAHALTPMPLTVYPRPHVHVHALDRMSSHPCSCPWPHTLDLMSIPSTLCYRRSWSFPRPHVFDSMPSPSRSWPRAYSLALISMSLPSCPWLHALTLIPILPPDYVMPSTHLMLLALFTGENVRAEMFLHTLLDNLLYEQSDT